MNLPNKITVSRVGLTFVMVVFLTTSIPWGKTLALFTFGLAGLTDWWDGALARRHGFISVFGQLMDPLADKILVSAAFISFASLHQVVPAFAIVHQVVPAWIVIMIISREFLITGLRLLATQKGLVLPAGKWGKHKMIWQTVTIVVIMAGLSLQHDVLPVLLAGQARYADPLHQFNFYFAHVAVCLAGLVGLLTVGSGVVCLWESRDVYMESI
jgi:CDP-diacylglycerol--glycerol-3-phosphate 3-phosphatidyltransferase